MVHDIRNSETKNNRQQPEKRCANCFACKQDTELCPLNENYNPDAYLEWEARYLQRRNERDKEQKQVR